MVPDPPKGLVPCERRAPEETVPPEGSVSPKEPVVSLETQLKEAPMVPITVASHPPEEEDVVDPQAKRKKIKEAQTHASVPLRVQPKRKASEAQSPKPPKAKKTPKPKQTEGPKTKPVYKKKKKGQGSKTV